MAETVHSDFSWLNTGNEALAQMLAAIESARHSIRLEMYIFHTGPIGDGFRQALINACQRGLRVKVLVDAAGSIMLPDSFWDVFRTSGGQFHWFNPIHLNRIGFRDHRKILVCDDAIAFIGGFNIATEYQGDGINSGWRDLGLKIHGALVDELAAAFDDMFACADFKHKPFARLRRSARQKTVYVPDGKLLITGPGRRNPLKQALRQDLQAPRTVQIICAYFLPPWRMRRQLARLARQGVKIQLILPGKTDVAVSRLAAQSFYRRLLAAGVEIYEYQPQILHAKLFIIDDVVYVGSANLDPRSLSINYEIMLRLPQPRLAAEARKIFQDDLPHCRRITSEAWRRQRTFWGRIKARLAYLLLARVDPFIARLQWRVVKSRFATTRKKGYPASLGH